MTKQAHPDAPVFLVGSQRSGTTMLRLMIGHHPDICFHGEFEFVTPLVTEDGHWPDLEEFYDFLSSFRTFPGWNVEIDRQLSYPDLCRNFLEQKRRGSGARFFGSTVHENFHRLRFIWPDARYIHLIRDGRDVARSCIGNGWAGNVWTAAPRWLDAENQWDQLAALLDDDRYIEVRYEEILKDPVAELRRICEFIGVPYDDAMLEYPSSTTYGKPDYKFAYQWKRWKSEYDVRLAESRMAEMLVKRGYELSGLAPLEVSEAEVRKLMRQDRAARVKFRLNKFGLRLTTEEMLARVLGIHAWRRSVKRRMNVIAREHLR